MVQVNHNEMLRGVLLTLCCLLSGCSVAQKVCSLDFQNCLLYEKTYSEINIEIPKGLKKKKVKDYHGYCEYQFRSRDGSMVYLSTNVYSGSYANSENRLRIGISTYAISRSLELVDTIKNEGKQGDGRYWLEYVLGDIVVGYLNVPTNKKSEYDNAIASLRRKK